MGTEATTPESTQPTTTPEPVWLASLRKNMLTEIQAVTDELSTKVSPASPLIDAALTDRAVGLAASYLHSLQQRITELEETDRLGEHFRVAGWVEEDSQQDDYCGFCSREAQIGVPAYHQEWPCPDVRTWFRRQDEPSPELREVREGQQQDGDSVTITGHYRKDPGGLPDGSVYVETGDRWFGAFSVTAPTVTVARPVLLLPKLEGAVIRCRVLSSLDRYVAERYEGRWLVAGLPNPDQSGIVSRGFGDDQITEVIAILDPGRAPADGQDE